MAVSHLKPKKQPAHQNPSSTTLKGYTMKQYLLPIIAALLLGACTTYTYTPTLFRQERILGFYGEKAGTGSSTKPQMYIITNKNEYSIALPPVFQAAQQAGIFNDAVRYRLSMGNPSGRYYVGLDILYPYSESREKNLQAFDMQLRTRGITAELGQKFRVSKTDDGKSIHVFVAADTNWQQVKLQNREALLAQNRLATPITLEIREEGRTQRSVKPLDGSSIGMLLLSPILVPAILFTGGLKPSR